MNNLQKLQNDLFDKLQIYDQITGVFQSKLIMWLFLKLFVSESFYLMEDMWLIQMRSISILLIHTDEKTNESKTMFRWEMFTDKKNCSTV